MTVTITAVVELHEDANYGLVIAHARRKRLWMYTAATAIIGSDDKQYAADPTLPLPPITTSHLPIPAAAAAAIFSTKRQERRH